ncbi:MAG: acyl carrier protein [Cyanophyceae cyanobacterium]
MNQPNNAPSTVSVPTQKSPSPEDIQTWIVNYLAELLEEEPEQVDVTLPFEQYGLDSAEAVELSGDLEDWLERKLNPTLLYNYPTIEALAERIAQDCQDQS